MNDDENAILASTYEGMRSTKVADALIALGQLQKRQIYVNTSFPTDVPSPEGPLTQWGETYPTVAGLKNTIFLNPKAFHNDLGMILNGTIPFKLSDVLWHEDFHLRAPNASENQVRAMTIQLRNIITDKYYGH
ncbi:MAG: hypothetical protein ABI387_07120 [Lacunisphaera sp.]